MNATLSFSSTTRYCSSTCGVSARGLSEPVQLEQRAPAGEDAAPALVATRAVCFEGTGFIDTAIYERDHLRPGMIVEGPAVIEEETSATVIPPHTRAQVLVDLGLLVELTNASGVPGS